MDYLPNTKFKLKQTDEGLKINTDTMLLGEFIHFKKGSKVLDIGTQTGALLMYASQYNPSLMVGVDINDKALQLAKENMSLNQLQACFYHSSIQTFNHQQFDVILCNPPYFSKSIVNDQEMVKVARHDNTLTLVDLMLHVRRLLKTNGRFFCSIRVDRFFEAMSAVMKAGLYCNECQFVYDENKLNAISVVFSVSFKQGFKVLPNRLITHKKV